ncbi:MAG: glycosyltransferase [Rivularia sp. T60_A2020_040]|nr:glycosyltransferase [Rivularia sp. T60_A2020_040]
MKVLHVIPSIADIRGGPSQAVLQMVKALRNSGIEAEIATTNDNGLKVLDVPLYQCIDYREVPVWFLPRFSPPMKEFIFSAGMTNWLWQHIRDYQLLHNHYLFSYASTCAGAIARHQGIPYTVRTIGQLTPWALAQSQFKKRVYTSLIERRNLNNAAAIHCTSQGEAKDVQKFGIKSPTITLPLGVNQPINYPQAKLKLHQKYGVETTKPIVLFLSRLHYKKRPDLLIQALEKLTAQKYKFHLILAGSGEYEYINYLKSLVASVGLTACTSFAGFVTGEDKDLLLQGADMFVLPSFSENFGIAIAEAMAVGIPVIITPGIQIAPSIAEAEAGLVVEGQVNTLTAAIEKLLAFPQLRQQLGENGRQFVHSNYSWSTIAKDLSSVYSAIIHKQTLPQHLLNN